MGVVFDISVNKEQHNVCNVSYRKLKHYRFSSLPHGVIAAYLELIQITMYFWTERAQKLGLTNIKHLMYHIHNVHALVNIRLYVNAVFTCECIIGCVVVCLYTVQNWSLLASFSGLPRYRVHYTPRDHCACGKLSRMRNNHA